MRKQNNFFGKIVDKLENKAFSKRDTIDKYGPWGLWIFVAIPLPGTGAWTGAFVAAMLDMPLKKAFPSILVGVIIASIIMGLGSYGIVSLLF